VATGSDLGLFCCTVPPLKVVGMEETMKHCQDERVRRRVNRAPPRCVARLPTIRPRKVVCIIVRMFPRKHANDYTTCVISAVPSTKRSTLCGRFWKTVLSTASVLTLFKHLL
jgi:hypothetical protein